MTALLMDLVNVKMESAPSVKATEKAVLIEGTSWKTTSILDLSTILEKTTLSSHLGVSALKRDTSTAKMLTEYWA